jgi:hypothetical protein
MSSLAPVALFVHARIDHTVKVINALKLNELATSTELYIFSDGARNNDEENMVSSIRLLISNIEGFKKVNIVERQENYGLKLNIVEGLNQVLNEHESVIVLEDDCVTSPDFLSYMNYNLKFYSNDYDDVWHISAWNPGVNFENKTFPSYYMSCWGWATWKYRWQELCFEPLELMGRMSLAERYRFNLKGRYPFYSHLLGNYLGINNTWAVFWYATIFTSQGHCINPPKSLITNLGMDGSGTHSAIYFDQQNKNVKYKKFNENTNVLDDTLNALSDVFGVKQTKIQYTYGLIKMLLPLWILKLVKELKG